jgi:hypothetical protein
VSKTQEWRRWLRVGGWLLVAVGTVGSVAIFANLFWAKDLKSVFGGGDVLPGMVALVVALTAISLGCDAFIVRGRLQSWPDLPRRARSFRIVGLSLAMIAVGAVTGLGIVSAYLYQHLLIVDIGFFSDSTF